MNIESATVADYAIIDQQGKLSILGIFDIVGGETFPLVQPKLFVCLRISCRPIEEGTAHSLSIVIQDADGRAISPKVGGPFQVPRNAVPGAPLLVQAVFQFIAVTFPLPGQYSVEVAIDEGHRTSIPLFLVQGGSSA